MAVLAELTRGLISIQCDVCIPPVLTINTPVELRRTGWSLRADDGPLDVCPNCSYRVAPRDRVRRGDPEPVAPDRGLLPNLVIVGATKAGTTSMHNYLDVHPDIAVSDEKELRFFQDPDGRDWIGAYQARFRSGTRYRVESTPFYSKTPCFPGVVDRIADLVPDARIIYLVRDPVDRLVAEYAEQLQWQSAGGSIAAELVDAEDPRNYLVASSRYGTQLRDYLRRFGADRVLVVDLADLSADTVAVMGGVFDSLGLDRLDVTREDFGLFNTREEKAAYPEWIMRLRRGAMAGALRRVPAGPRRAVSQFAWRRLRAPVERPEVDEATLARLREVLRPEADELRALTGQEFASWSV